MQIIQKQLEKKENELPKQISKNIDNKKITQTERKKWKLEKQIIPQNQKQKFPQRHNLTEKSLLQMLFFQTVHKIHNILPKLFSILSNYFSSFW